jgi:hypothetical protein
MVASISHRLAAVAVKLLRHFSEVRLPERGAGTVNLLYKFLLGSRLCFVLVTLRCAPSPDRSQPSDTAFCFALGGAT